MGGRARREGRSPTPLSLEPEDSGLPGAAAGGVPAQTRVPWARTRAGLGLGCAEQEQRPGPGSLSCGASPPGKRECRAC